MILPGSTPESVEGLAETWLVYRMKATIERGMLQQNSVARKQVRIIRTLDTGALELAHAMVIPIEDTMGFTQPLMSGSLLKMCGRIRSTTLSVHLRKL